MCYKSFIIFSLFFIYKLAYANTVDIQISEVNTNLRFILSSENKLDSSIFLLKDPSRLVIDFKDIDRFVKQKIKSNYIKDIRASKTKDSSRLVFDIDFNPKNIAVTRVFSFNKYKNNIVIDLNTNNISNINNYIIIVDPGHGGKDPGAIKGNTKEKKLTLLAAKILQKELKKKGFDVFLTREKDQYISLRNRVKFARKYGLPDSATWTAINIVSEEYEKLRDLELFHWPNHAHKSIKENLNRNSSVHRSRE